MKKTLCILFCGLFVLINLTGCNLKQIQQQYDHVTLSNANFKKQTLTLKNKGELHYWEGGKGDTVLLLHGFGGSATATWREVMKQLSQNYRVIAPDLLWFGQSYAQETANLQTQTLAISTLMTHLNLPNYHVAGISYGGFVAYDLMLHDKRVDKTVIIASPGPTFNKQDLQQLVQRANVSTPEALFVPTTGDEVKRLMNLVFFKKKSIPPFIANEIYDDYFSEYRPEKVQLIQTLLNERERIQDTPPPSKSTRLIIWGKHDQIFPLHYGERLSQHLNAPLKILENTGHGVTNEQPEQVTKLLRGFFG
jgi:pimeloyl-ACP methyl ester carboxylesterase